MQNPDCFRLARIDCRLPHVPAVRRVRRVRISAAVRDSPTTDCCGDCRSGRGRARWGTLNDSRECLSRQRHRRPTATAGRRDFSQYGSKSSSGIARRTGLSRNRGTGGSRGFARCERSCRHARDFRIERIAGSSRTARSPWTRRPFRPAGPLGTAWSQWPPGIPRAGRDVKRRALPLNGLKLK